MINLYFVGTAGNDFDQAALLSDLLRAADVTMNGNACYSYTEKSIQTLQLIFK
ncbi:MAG: hypothetical protein ABH874_01210 [Methanobacteriota archaeon]